MTARPEHRVFTDELMRLVGGCAGLAFAPSRRDEFEAAVRRAMSRAGTTDLAEYFRTVQGNAPALDALIAELTIGETYFFRDPDQFELIRREILPAILRRRPDGPIQVWSAGCASGEEAYSLAILLQEANVGDRARVVGTDIARYRLAQARRGRYTSWSLRGMPDDVVARYFRRQGRQFEIVPEIRAALEFRYLNLADGVYPSAGSGIQGMDLILCRNVLIYLDGATVARVARRLLDSLRDGGWLLLGAADPPLGTIVPCESVVTPAGVVYRRQPGGSIGPILPEPVLSPAHDPPHDADPAPPPPPALREASLQPRTTLAETVATVRRLANEGRLDDAGRACAAALDRHPDSAELLYLHALLLAEAGHHAESAVAARRALYLDRNLAVAHLGLGCALARLGDTDGARRAFRNAEELLAALPPSTPVPAADGEPAGRLAEIARVQLRLLGEAA